MYNQELMDERRRLLNARPGVASGVGPKTSGAVLSGAGAVVQRSFSSSVSAFGASLKSSMAHMAENGSLGPAHSGHVVPGSVLAGGAMDGVGSGLDEQDCEALRAEVQYLRSRIKATIEEAEEFRTVAADAQGVVDATERAARTARSAPAVVPCVDQVRRALSLQRSNRDSFSAPVDEATLRSIAAAAVELVYGARATGSDGSPAEASAPSSSSAADPQDGEARLLRTKIQQQQRELDMSMQTFQAQQKQIASLIAQAF
mmetsp:Transcript_2652/g.7598  ORF Transcript_2652/g.7598 Transcript_2652/m.7598 type:complete len:259 (-) Transcript_2652:12-788(-)